MSATVDRARGPLISSFIPVHRLVLPTLLITLAAGSSGAPAPSAVPRPRRDLPIVVSKGDWHPLAEALDAGLQMRLERAFASHDDLARLSRQGRLCVALVDLANPLAPRLARINGDRMIYAASLPKIAVLLAAFEGFQDGSLEETPGVLRDLEAMIRVSSNAAATRLIERIGLERIDEVLMLDRYRLFDAASGGGLWVGRAYAKQSRRLPDPVAGLSHGATAMQVARFYYLLAHGRLVSPIRSAQMLGFLSNPGLRHKFVYPLQATARLGNVFRKSGTWRNWHSDSVLVWEEGWRRYILVGLVRDAQGEQVLRRLVPLAEGLLRPDPSRSAIATASSR